MQNYTHHFAFHSQLKKQNQKDQIFNMAEKQSQAC